MSTLGEITLTDKGKECDVQWKMTFPETQSRDTLYWSPLFSFKGENWLLGMWPKGWNHFNGAEGIHLCLKRVSSTGPPITVEFTLAITAANGQKVLQRQRTEDFKGDSFHIVMKFISRSDFDKQRSEFLNSGFLKLVCTMRKITSTGNESTNTEEKCFCCKENLDAEYISLRQKCIDRRIKCPYCSHVVPLKSWLNGHECPTERTEDFRNENITLKKKLEVAESSVDEIEKQRAALEDSLEKHQAELEHLTKKCEDAQLMLEKTMKEKDDIKKEGDAYKSGLEAGLKVFKEDLSDLRNENNSLKKKLEVAEQEFAGKIEKERAAHKEEIEKLEDSLLTHQAGLGFQCQIM